MEFTKEVIVCLCVVGLVASSAIPMWEMLSREEKMAYLYAQFTSQVENYCEFSEMPNCNKELMKYGISKLHSMPDEHLDRMDPYQRGANNIIWNSMMIGHNIMKQKPTKPTTAAPSTKPSTPNKIQNIQDQIKEYQGSSYISNDIFAESNFYNTAASNRFEEVVPATGSEFSSGMGPMIVRVRPDGTLVDRKLPVDEDLIHFRMSKTKIPPKNMLDTFIDNLRPSRSSHLAESQPYAVYVSPNY